MILEPLDVVIPESLVMRDPVQHWTANCPKDIQLAVGSHHRVANIRKQTLAANTPEIGSETRRHPLIWRTLHRPGACQPSSGRLDFPPTARAWRLNTPCREGTRFLEKRSHRANVLLPRTARAKPADDRAGVQPIRQRRCKRRPGKVACPFDVICGGRPSAVRSQVL